MTRYIDAESAIGKLLTVDNQYSAERDFAINSINSEPTADVQPVVHCVKCKYRDKMEFCILNDIFINEKDFCSKGDKLDGDEHDNG